MASSSTASIHKSFKYDVFLSFRGEDTRTNFIDHLYHALEHKSIRIYKDDEKIKKGKRISDDLMGSIEESKFYIIVFSKNYASSSWCLEELVKIMECQKAAEHTAYPVFYDVEPTEIRKQSGVVKDAFAKNEKEEAAGKWRAAMKEAADLAGWELKNTADGHEAKFIQKIVEEISLELCTIDFSADEKLIGMETRVKNVVSSLEIGIDDVLMIGIKGMGGAGKTTLARAVFDQISFQFEGKSFVENVREVSNASLSGLKSLQNQVLSDALNDRRINLSGVSDGKNMIKRMMGGRKVLLVLDDVDQIDQLEALAGEPNWFKPGSRIIITTRDEQLLVAHKVKLILNVDLLSDNEAICLFSRHAFGREIPIQGYEELSRQVVRYASGLPLTSKVLGSFLCGKAEVEWTDALERLKTIPLAETLKKLELSFIGLEEDYKEIFLDVACILKGKSKDDVIHALECCGFHARNGLKVLQQKSLITFRGNKEREEIHDAIEESLITFRGSKERVEMHDHIEEMAKNIVRRSHPDHPYKHSRLWIGEEIEIILANDLGTEATRCIRLSAKKLSLECLMNGLKKMKELRLLIATVDDTSKSQIFWWKSKFIRLPISLLYMEWHGYPFRSLPKKIPNNLVSLEMTHSNIGKLWGGGERKVLYKLRFLYLSSIKLKTLDLGLAPNLERLCLFYCYKLVKVCMPVKCPNLEKLSIGGCNDLVELRMPVEILKLRSFYISCPKLKNLDLGSAPNLEQLLLSKCHDMEELHMHDRYLNLTSIVLGGTQIRTLDLGLAPNIKKLNLRFCNNLVKVHMPVKCLNLETFTIRGCNDLVELHMPVEFLKLTYFYLSCPKLRKLDLGLAPNLEQLHLLGCHDMEGLHMHGRYLNLTSIELKCSKLRTLDLGLTPNLEKLELKGCHSLIELHAPVGCLDKVSYLDLSDSSRFSSFLFQLKDRVHAVGPLTELYLIAEPLERCLFHPENNLPKFRFACYYNRDLSSLDRNLEMLISFGLCACTNIERFSKSICGLQRLRKLTLKGRFLEAPRDLNELECLEELSFLSTDIKHLPDSICMLKHLKSLKLGSCRLLEKLPEDLGRLDGLEMLRLSNIEIKHLPDSICMLKHLLCLELVNCELLEKLPGDLGRLECLEKLIIRSCKSLRGIPNSIGEMKCLKCFNLCYCINVEKLPEELGRLKCLEKLNIEGTNISDLPQSILLSQTLRIYGSGCTV